jgi:hypothetical protein
MQEVAVGTRDRMSEFAWNGRVYVLGAGASVFAGYPLSSELMGFVRGFRSLDSKASEIASRVIDKLNTAEILFSKQVRRDPNGVATLEDLLTYLELYGSFPGTMFDLNPWNEADSSDVRRLVTDRFLYYQHDLNLSVWRNRSPVDQVTSDPKHINRVCEAWSKKVEVGDVIITFNWDILHEIALWSTGLWSYRDGYGFECDDQGKRESQSATQILKLHGSVNWAQQDESRPIKEIAHVSDFFSGSRDWDARSHVAQAQTDSGRKLILPTYLKDISSNVVLLDLWSKAFDFISHATTIVVAGYSLNRVDHPARLMFGTALSQNKALTSVTVVSPGATDWDVFLYQLNKTANRIRSKFEDWVIAAP